MKDEIVQTFVYVLECKIGLSDVSFQTFVFNN